MCMLRPARTSALKEIQEIACESRGRWRRLCRVCTAGGGGGVHLSHACSVVCPRPPPPAGKQLPWLALQVHHHRWILRLFCCQQRQGAGRQRCEAAAPYAEGARGAGAHTACSRCVEQHACMYTQANMPALSIFLSPATMCVRQGASLQSTLQTRLPPFAARTHVCHHTD